SLWDTLRGVAEEVAEEKVKDRTVGRARRRYAGMARFTVLTLGAVLLAALIAYPDATEPALTWDGYLQSLALGGLAAGLVLAAAYGIEWGLTRRFGADRGLRPWWSGIASLVATSLFAGSPFGSTVHAEGEPTGARLSVGRFLLALQFAVFGLTLPLALLALNVSYDFGAMGLTAVFALTAANLLPFQPLPGASIWRWNRGVSLAMAFAGVLGYVAWQVGWIGLTAILVAGTAAPLVAVALLAWPRKGP
ncbi:MAG TPA: hypothetical protein VNZ52_13735, partial [Candidatus Thermoplasmatota archaeon]|nr:hypothetical protein [Candidatus Thermoplasmatota archaeon]